MTRTWYSSMNDDIERLRAQVAELEKDAKRYRWLRERVNSIVFDTGAFWDEGAGKVVTYVRSIKDIESLRRPLRSDSVDAAIDAAMNGDCVRSEICP